MAVSEEENQKIDQELRLAVSIPEEERLETPDLAVGYEAEKKEWEVLVRYAGSLDQVRVELTDQITLLSNGYAVITLLENQIPLLTGYPEIIYVEKPKRLYEMLDVGVAVSCVTPLWRPDTALFGSGVLVGIIDSGIAYSHPDFCVRDDDGNYVSRIYAIWDQTLSKESTGLTEEARNMLPPPPEGFLGGALFTQERINEALLVTGQERLNLVPERDVSGHGTHVAGIACGNGNASNGRYRGMAPESTLLVVKMGTSVGSSFPQTTRLMEGVEYCIRTANELKMPLVLNLSFGNSYGGHDGKTLVEQYLDEALGLGQITIVTGSGNEGDTGKHQGWTLQRGEETVVELAVGPGETSVSFQIWKTYADEMQIILESPLRERWIMTPGISKFSMGNTKVYALYGEPSPYQLRQELYLVLSGYEGEVEQGVWRIHFVPEKIVDGRYDIWLQSGNVLNPVTRFLSPVLTDTLTIPSTADNVITVSAYDPRTSQYASFSGRGPTAGRQQKPDLAAPGVGIMSTAPGGGYQSKSGTSMAAPFVSGGAALLMEWGIVRGNDPFLYGEKVKAYLISGARKLPGFQEYPNSQVGWGALCVSDSIPI